MTNKRKLYYTAFCQKKDGGKTIWIEKIGPFREDADIEDVREVAREVCAEAWRCAVEEVHCLGLAVGDVTIAYWGILTNDT